MFERYTEKARRVIFFARSEASNVGSPYIEAEHLMLGLFREDKGFAERYSIDLEEFMQTLRDLNAGSRPRPPMGANVDLPLSNESKRALSYAAEEADDLQHRHIGTEHLFLGILREENCLPAQMMRERGVVLHRVRNGLKLASGQPGTVGLTATAGGRRSGRVIDNYLSGWSVRIDRPGAVRLEFQNEADGAILGSSRTSTPPEIGHEILVGTQRARVKRVVHAYANAPGQGQLTPQKIVVYVEILSA